MRKTCPLLVAVLLSCLPFSGSAEEAYQVTGKAWSALGRKDWNAVIAHADRALRTWGSQAKQTNAKLSGYAPAKDAKKYANAALEVLN